MFVLQKGKERLLVSFQATHEFRGQTVHYVGVKNGLGGYRKLIDEGWVDRRFNRPEITFNKLQCEIIRRILKKIPNLKKEINVKTDQ